MPAIPCSLRLKRREVFFMPTKVIVKLIFALMRLLGWLCAASDLTTRATSFGYFRLLKVASELEEFQEQPAHRSEKGRAA